MTRLSSYVEVRKILIIPGLLKSDFVLYFFDLISKSLYKCLYSHT